MKLDELRAEMQSQADQARDDTARPHRVAEVRARVDRMRRHRAAVVVAGAAAAVLAAVAVVVPVLDATRSAPEPATTPRPTPTVAEALPKPTVWPEQFPSAQLVHGVVGKRGESQLVSTFTVGDTNLEWADVCDLPSVEPYVANGPLIVASVNGRFLNGTGCVAGDSTLSGTDMSHGQQPQTNRRGWALLGVEPGDTITVRAWLEAANGKRITRSDVRLGFALYERTGPR
jgi:hypothetical protein